MTAPARARFPFTLTPAPVAPCPPDDDVLPLCGGCGHPSLNHGEARGDGNAPCALCGIGLTGFVGVAV